MESVAFPPSATCAALNAASSARPFFSRCLRSLEEGRDALRVLRHARLDDVVGPGRVPEELRLLGAQREDLVEDEEVRVDGAVLELLVQRERELPILGVLEDGEVVRVVGRDDDLAVLARRVRRDPLLGEALELGRRCRHRQPRGGDVGLEVEAELREALVDDAEARLTGLVEIEPVAPKIAECALEQPGPHGRERLLLRCGARGDPRQRRIEPQARVERVDLRLAQLGLLARALVGVRARHERGEVPRVAEGKLDAIELAERGVPRQRRVGGAIERADLGERGLRARDALVAEPLEPRARERGVVRSAVARARPPERHCDGVDVEGRERGRRGLRGGRRDRRRDGGARGRRGWGLPAARGERDEREGDDGSRAGGDHG